MKWFFGKCDRPVLIATVLVLIALSIASIIAGEEAAFVVQGIVDVLYKGIDWLLALYPVACIIFVLYVSFSRWGKLKLGNDDDKPEYSTFAWISMLTCAGLAVGLVFWSVAEPLIHYMNTPYLAEPQSDDAILIALAITDLNWGIPVWTIFAVAGLAIGVAAYRNGKPLSYSSAFIGLFNMKENGIAARIFNFIFSAFAVVGISVSLGMGVIAISYRFEAIFGFDAGFITSIGVMVCIGALFTISSIVGIKQGMARVSKAAVIIALLLLVFIILAGPTSFVLRVLVQSLGVHIVYFPYMLTFTDPTGATQGWPTEWSLFYWAWTLVTMPYVGGFFAQISKGRSIRQYCFGTIIPPTALSIVWFTGIGGAAIDLVSNGTSEIWEATQANTESSFFILLDYLPLGAITTAIALVVLILFMATSCDSVINYISRILSYDEDEPRPGLKLTIALVIILCPLALIAGGGLQTIKNVTLIAAVPFLVLGILNIISTIRLLNEESTEEHTIT